MCENQRQIHVKIKRLKNWFEHISSGFSANEKTKCKCLISLSDPLHKSTKHVQKICAMPQYDDSFLLDCEKKRNARSYKPYKKSAISNGTNDSTKLPQDYGTIGKWRKKYFTLKRIASPSPPPSMPIYRSMHSFDDNSTFNCKLNHNSSALLIKPQFLFDVHILYIGIQSALLCTNASLDSLSLKVCFFLIGFRYLYSENIGHMAATHSMKALFNRGSNFHHNITCISAKWNVIVHIIKSHKSLMN